jgi:beta-lactamase superfamily II metal-dependent hydrolase
VAILLSYGTARVLLAGDAEAKEEEYLANGSFTRPQAVINVSKLHTHSEPRFRALLTEGTPDLELALV